MGMEISNGERTRVTDAVSLSLELIDRATRGHDARAINR